MRHAALNRSDARPGVQPAAKCLNLRGATGPLLAETREVQRSQQQASTRIEHWRESIIRLPCRMAARAKTASRASRVVMMGEASSRRSSNFYALSGLYISGPAPKVHQCGLPGRLRVRPAPKEKAPPGTRP